jgi:hypothetical protein
MKCYQAIVTVLNGSPAGRALRVLLAVLELADFYQGANAIRPTLEAAFQGGIDALASSVLTTVSHQPRKGDRHGTL